MVLSSSARRGLAGPVLLLLAALAGVNGGCSGGDDAPPARLSLVAGGAAHAANGGLVEPAPVLQLVDASGGAVARAGVPVRVALVELQGTLSGTSILLTDDGGRARFTDLRVAGPAGTYHLTFSSAGLAGTTSTLDLAAGAPARLRATTLQRQYAPEGAPVSEPPGVLVFDAANNPVPGAHVLFTRTYGGGWVSGDAMTGPDGQAYASTWVLGATGGHAVEARVEGLEGDGVVFTASALPALGMLRVARQPPGTAHLGEVITPAPEVQLFDAYGYPSQVAGVPVTVGLGSGSGGVTGTLTVTTDASGRAAFPDLAFSDGVEGVRTLRFWSAQRTPVDSAPVYVGTAGAASAYAITLRYLTGATQGQSAAFEAARARIGGLITGDVPDAFLGEPPMPDCGNTPISEVVDDLLVWVELRPIDGYGGILGQAGPCIVRAGSLLPAVGIVMLDTADLPWLESTGQLGDVILHELLHVVGFGVLWPDLGLAAGLGTSDPVFTGPGARAAFAGFDGGASYGGVPVPVENTGEPGTRDSHWRESVFGSELMTGWLSPGPQPLGRTTIASLEDMGYAVDLAKGEAVFGTSGLRSGAAMASGVIDVGPDALRVRLREVQGM